MPELPDVEVYRRYLTTRALRQRVRRVHAPEPRILAGITPQSLGKRLHGRTFRRSERFGKYLLVQTENGYLVMHFGMTGRLAYQPTAEPVPDHCDLSIEFFGGHRLAYLAPRKLGRITWTDDRARFLESKHLGPDALSLDWHGFQERASARHGAVKAWLMDQSTIAGIGNVYSDEILFQARIHPRTPVAQLDARRLKRLYDGMQRVLRAAIEAKADPKRMPAHFLLPHRSANQLCPGCGGKVQRITVSGRSAYFCPRCQPKRS